MIRSRPCNPTAQEKVEQSHKERRRKIYYDMVSLKDKGVNWVENLPNYVRVLNELERKALGWCSPFGIYYGESQIL